MSYWDYWCFRCFCLREPFNEAIAALKQSSFMLIMVLGTALPAAAFSILYGYGLLFDVASPIASVKLASWLILLVQTLWMLLLRDSILAIHYQHWLSSLPTSKWLIHTTSFSLTILFNIMLCPLLIILLNIASEHWFKLGHIFVFLLIQLVLGVTILRSSWMGLLFVLFSYLAIQISGECDSLCWMLLLLSLLCISVGVYFLCRKIHRMKLNAVTDNNGTRLGDQNTSDLNSGKFSVNSQCLSYMSLSHMRIVSSWVYHNMPSLMFRGAMILLVVSLADLIRLETLSETQDLGDYIGDCLMLILVSTAGTWQFSISQGLQRISLFLFTLPKSIFVRCAFMLLPGLLFFSGLLVAMWSLSDWLQLRLDDLILLSLLLGLLQYLTDKWPKQFAIWALILVAIYSAKQVLIS